MSAQHKLKFEQHEATHRGTVNTDYVLTEGRAADNRDPDDYAEPCDDSEVRHRVRRQPDWYYDTEKPLKRGNADQLRLLPKHDEPSQWHVGHVREGRDWTNNETPLTRLTRNLDGEATEIIGTPAAVPEERWSMIPLRCSVCWAVLIKRDITGCEGWLPSLPDKVRYCSKPCERTADAARKARKRRLAKGVRKYPRDGRQSPRIRHSRRPDMPKVLTTDLDVIRAKDRQPYVEWGWYINQYEPWPRRGLNVIRPNDLRDDLEVRHGIMRGVRRMPQVAPAWWTITVKSILDAA